jgi:hypothetical protein
MNLSPHFTLAELTHSEYAIRNGISNVPGTEITGNLKRLAEHLELVRSCLGNKPIVVSSGYRSTKLNAAIGGSKTSAHLMGNAADILCPAFGTPTDVVAALRQYSKLLQWDQMILEWPASKTGGWLHFGLADKPRGEVLEYDGKKYTVLV